MINNLIENNGLNTFSPSITFTELTLKNFGLYRGEQTINLQVTAIKPIVLIKGMNGCGKTTILDAIRLALYGIKANPSTRGKLKYADFLHQCLNSQAGDNESASIQLTFLRTTQKGGEIEISVRRTWRRGDRRDKLEVYKKGKLDSVLTASWDEQIEELLPVAISHLFLFDGEQIQEITSSNQLPANIVGAIRNLLDLDIPDTVQERLDKLIRRKRIAVATPKELETLSYLQEQLGLLMLKQNQAENLEAYERQELDKALEQLKLAQERFLTLGGNMRSQLPQNESDLAQLHEACADTRNQMRRVAADVMPMRLIEPLLCRLQAQYNVESELLNRDILLKYIQKRNVRLLEFLPSIDDNSPEFKDQLQQLSGFLREEEEEIAALSGDDTYLGATPEAMARVDFVLRELPHSIHEAASQIATLHSLTPQIEATERLIATAASPEDYQTLKSKIEEAQALVTDRASRYELKTRHLEQICAELAAVKRSLSDFSDVKERSQALDEFVQSAATAKKSIDAFGERLVLSRISTLEQLVTSCLTTILHKPELIHRVKIDPKTFEVFLYDAQDVLVPRHRISAGEKQLLASALLWGLARASGRKFPVVIDTPLARLDLSHRDNLVRDYFPRASHQVVILSTDTELKEPQVQQLQDAGVIARRYDLKFDSDRFCTRVV